MASCLDRPLAVSEGKPGRGSGTTGGQGLGISPQKDGIELRTLRGEDGKTTTRTLTV